MTVVDSLKALLEERARIDQQLAEIRALLAEPGGVAVVGRTIAYANTRPTPAADLVLSALVAIGKPCRFFQIRDRAKLSSGSAYSALQVLVSQGRVDKHGMVYVVAGAGLAGQPASEGKAGKGKVAPVAPKSPTKAAVATEPEFETVWSGKGSLHELGRKSN